MMKTRITERDWEILSAYLDGELNAKDAARLESKLRGNADLRDALTELRHTRALLRSQPRLRAPRNFTLTQETAGIRQPVQPARRLSPVFGMVSAFASLLLIVVILGDMFISQPMGVSREMSSAPATYSDVQEVERMAEATSEGALPQEEAPQVLMEQAQPPAGAAEPRWMQPAKLPRCQLRCPPRRKPTPIRRQHRRAR
jgi:anti-sigma factor RsiW